MVNTKSEALLVLGLGRVYDKEILKTRYNNLVKLYHPDTTPFKDDTSEAFDNVLEAYKVLSNALDEPPFRHGSSILQVIGESI